MSGFKEYQDYDGLGLADLVKAKEVSAGELLDAAIERSERVNPDINAVIRPMHEQARATVKESLPDGPFTGVPFLLKDLLADYAGVPTSNASKVFQNVIPDSDSELVKRFKQSGVVIMGKTNCPEFGLQGTTEPELFGATRNPWCLDHTPGGSSGGSAAAVAAGIVPMASGGDGGGSIRVPAAYCGLFGLKPSRGRNPTGPRFGQLWQGAVAEHILSRSVRDSAAMLDAVHGIDSGASCTAPVPSGNYLNAITQAPRSLTIAFSTQSPVGTRVDAGCIKAVEETAKLLASLGHHVEEATPDLDGKALVKSFMMLFFGELSADLEAMESVLGRKVRPADVETATWTLGLLGKAYSAGQFVQAMRLWGQTARVMGAFHQRFDLYLTPTTAFPPAKIGELKAKPAQMMLMKLVNTLNLGQLLKRSGVVDQMAIGVAARTPFTQLANFTGQPAMSVPLYWTAEGLPCGVQFVAPFGDEATLLQLAAQLEQVKPWFDKRAPIGAYH